MTSSQIDAGSESRPTPGSPTRWCVAASRVGWIAIVAVAAGMTLATPSMASENLVLIPDYALFGLFGLEGIGTLWIMLVGFVLLIFPLNGLLFQPIFRALDARAERIAGARARSVQLENEADEVLERYETAVRGARVEAEAGRQAQLGQAREEQAALTAQARSEAEAELERARADLGRSLEDARATLRAAADDLATQAAEQVLGRTLS